MTFQSATNKISALAILAEATNETNSGETNSRTRITHDAVLLEILDHLRPVNLRVEAELAASDLLTIKHQVVLTIRHILRIANELKCGLCINLGFIYSYNKEFWKLIDREEIKVFLGDAAKKLGVNSVTADYHKFLDELYRQFFVTAYLPKPRPKSKTVLINVQNGTGEITKGRLKLRPFNRADFLTYQLNFAYDEKATCPKWQKFLDRVLPEKDENGNDVDEGKSRQKVLAEYIGYVFTRHLKLEKTLLLYGGGANGKGVFFEVISAILGTENVSNYSLESLGDQYYRAMIANKLLNYSSEISNRLQSEKFKQLTSGEPIEARLPYGQPITLTNYAKLTFNTNELPKDVEHTEAYFRRFMIVPFDVTIPEEKQNKNLHNEIIEAELAGVFNWLLAGLNRLLEQGNFSKCDAAQKAVAKYRKESDSVAMFLAEENYKASSNNSCEYALKTLYQEYKSFCQDDGYKSLGKRKFKERLERLNITVEAGNANKTYVWIEKIYVNEKDEASK